MEKEQKILICYYCGNKTLMNLVCKHTEILYNESDCEECGVCIDEEMFIQNGSDLSDIEEEFERNGYTINARCMIISRVYICPVCQRATYTEYNLDIIYEDLTGETASEKVCFPISSFDKEGIPKEIEKAYDSALKTKNIDRAIATVALRRTLELICKENGVYEKSLDESLKKMVELNILPKTLKKASDITRKLGNEAAHTDNNISDYEFDIICKFIESILEYIYVLPMKMKCFDERFTKNK